MAKTPLFRTACSEPEEYLQSCQASMMQHFILRTLCNPGIFTTLVYAEPEE